MASGKGETAGGRERGGGGGVNMEPPSPPRSGRSAVAPHQPAPAPPPSPPPPPPPRATRPSAPRGGALLTGRPGSLRPWEVPAAGRREQRAGTPRVPGRPVPGRSGAKGRGGMEGGEADSALAQQKKLGLLRWRREAGAARVRSGGDGGLGRGLPRGRGPGMAASDRSCSREEDRGWRPRTGATPGDGGRGWRPRTRAAPVTGDAPVKEAEDGGLRQELLPRGAAGTAASSDKSCSGDGDRGWWPRMGAAPARRTGDGGLRQELLPRGARRGRSWVLGLEAGPVHS